MKTVALFWFISGWMTAFAVAATMDNLSAMPSLWLAAVLLTLTAVLQTIRVGQERRHP